MLDIRYSVPLRQYTYRFARNMVQLFPRFFDEKPYESLPEVPHFNWLNSRTVSRLTLYIQIPKVSANKTLIKLFSELDYDDLFDECSDLRDVLVYCRGSKLIRIHPEWRPLLPTELWAELLIHSSGLWISCTACCIGGRSENEVKFRNWIGTSFGTFKSSHSENLHDLKKAILGEPSYCQIRSLHEFYEWYIFHQIGSLHEFYERCNFRQIGSLHTFNECYDFPSNWEPSWILWMLEISVKLGAFMNSMTAMIFRQIGNLHKFCECCDFLQIGSLHEFYECWKLEAFMNSMNAVISVKLGAFMKSMNAMIFFRCGTFMNSMNALVFRQIGSFHEFHECYDFLQI